MRKIALTMAALVALVASLLVVSSATPVQAAPASAPAAAPASAPAIGKIVFKAKGGTPAEPFAYVYIDSPRSNGNHPSMLPMKFGSALGGYRENISMSVQRMYGTVPIYEGTVKCTIKVDGVRVARAVGTQGYVSCSALVGP